MTMYIVIMVTVFKTSVKTAIEISAIAHRAGLVPGSPLSLGQDIQLALLGCDHKHTKPYLVVGYEHQQTSSIRRSPSLSGKFFPSRS